MTSSQQVYEVRPRKDKRGVDLISDAAVRSPLVRRAKRNQQCNFGYAEHRSRSHDAVIRVSDAAGNLIETPEHAGDFKEW